MSDFLLTIAIPVYNREVFLRRLLNTIIPYINNDVELFVSDNASTDNTMEMMRSEFPDVICYRNEENLGADGNFLECYKKASGKYVWLVGSDDIITEGAIDRILQFITVNANIDMPLIFLNHNNFEGQYTGVNCCKPAYLDVNENDKVVHSKNELIEYAGRQLTFMSAFLLKKDYIDKVLEPERFLKTNFIQTYFALEVAKNFSDFGIIFYPCVSQDLTPGNSYFHNRYSRLFHVFGSCMYEVLVNHATKVDFDKKQMRQKYIKGMVKSFAFWLLSAKAYDDKDGLSVFWKEVYPNLRTYPVFWFAIFPSAVMPAWVAKLYYGLKKRAFRCLA